MDASATPPPSPPSPPADNPTSTGVSGMESPTPLVPPPAPPRRLHWGILLAFLFIPPVLTSLLAATGRPVKDAAVIVGLIGGGLGGIGVAIVLGIRFGREPATQAVFSFLLAVPCGIAVIGMSMFACLASGFNLNIH